MNGCVHCRGHDERGQFLPIRSQREGVKKIDRRSNRDGQLPGMTCGVAEHEWPVPANGSPNL